MLILPLIFLPLLNSICLGFFGRFLGKETLRITKYLTISTVIGSSLNVFFVLNDSNGSTVYINLFDWIVSDNIFISWGFILDPLSSIMLFVVCFISCVVHMYSIDYMRFDPHKTRFFSYLSLFTFFMILLITSDNFLQMFVGWEGVGVCSFLLINFWFTRLQANKAAIKAMLVNRIGDFSLILGIFLIFLFYNSLNYSVVFSLTPYVSTLTIQIFNLTINIVDLISLFIFFGAVGKSAQLGLHSWLPDAMEGPTPVSALLHSATMVTAGVFLLIRISPLLEYSTKILWLITLFGALTTFFAATIGLFQNDIKRIIAYSTCSQLGYMIFSCGLSNYTVSFFHLFNHAFFKALLFLCSGAIIHALYDEQDIRKMGGLKNLMPITYISMLIGSLALIGFPFLSGFYSKDLILESAFSLNTSSSLFSYVLGSLAAFCTAFYSTRLLYLVFLTSFNGFRSSLLQVHEGSNHTIRAFIFLLIPSMFSGYLTKTFFVGFGTTFWNNSIFINPLNFFLFESEFILTLYKQIPLYLTLLGILSWFILNRITLYKTGQYKLSTVGLFIFNFFNRKWYFDKFNNLFFSTFSLHVYNHTYFILDRGLLEQLGPVYSRSFLQSNYNVYKMYFTFSNYKFIYYSIVGIFFFISFICLLVYFQVF